MMQITLSLGNVAIHIILKGGQIKNTLFIYMDEFIEKIVIDDKFLCRYDHLDYLWMRRSYKKNENEAPN